jgi:ribosomal protein L11 methyltransferase
MPPPNAWFVLTVHVPLDSILRDLVSEGLLALGGLSVLETADSLVTYLEPSAAPEVQLARAAAFLSEWIGDDCPDLSWSVQPNEDWERTWRRGLQPRKVSRRFVVKPTWTAWSVAPDEIVIEIDPQMAFGTGEHATTRGCLRLLDSLIRERDRVLDVGSGSAILAIAAAKCGAASVVAIEFDPDANLNARENIKRNGVAKGVELLERSADPTLLASLGGFDLIAANILSSVILPLLPSLAGVLRPRGRLIVSGILQAERDDVVAAAGRTGLVLRQELVEHEWWSGAFTRPEG